MRHLWDGWAALGPRLVRRKKILFLDFDGTLAPIASSPDRVVVPAGVTRLLSQISRTGRDRVCIISGRSLRDLRSFFSLRNAVYAGNHGVELAGYHLGRPLRIKEAGAIRRLMRLVFQKYKNAYLYWPGVLVEDKTYSVAVHFRKLSPEKQAIFMEIFRFYLDHFARYPLVVNKGKKVFEIKPRSMRDKGDVVRYLMKKFPGYYPVALGDDRTDEDMFRALKGRGLSVRVGASQKSAAGYYLKSQSDVRRFLEGACLL